MGPRERRRLDSLPEAPILESATDCSYQKAGKEILSQGEDLTVSPEVVKKLVHHSPKDKILPPPQGKGKPPQSP